MSNRLSGELLAALQARAARIAIGASSMRGRGSQGVVRAGREHLRKLNLRPFGTSDPRRFGRALDRATEGLRLALPRRAQHWGLARKGLNIFLRECLYTVYLRKEYDLGAAEAFFELPLDSLTGNALKQAVPDSLPRWKTVRGLTPDLSDKFQTAARDVARRRGIAPVHLDAIWWGDRSDD